MPVDLFSAVIAGGAIGASIILLIIWKDEKK